MKKLKVKNKEISIGMIMVIFVILIFIFIVKIQGKETVKKPANQKTISSSVKKEDEAVEADVPMKKETFLFDVNTSTPFYILSNTGELDLNSYRGTIQGLYTGHYSTDYKNGIEIDYMDDVVLISQNDASVVDDAKVLPIGVKSQFNESQYGYSACGVACIYMMKKNFDYDIKNSVFDDYESFLNYAEEEGYGDQGSLLTMDGGMTCHEVKRLMKDVCGLELVNAYLSTQKPAQAVKTLIDNGKQAMILVNYNNGNVVTYQSVAHFIIITGYVELEGELSFVYADSYYTNVGRGNPLYKLDEEILNSSVTSYFNEPNAIMYISD